MYFQDLVLTLHNYWRDFGCLLTQPYDLEKGAGTFNPSTFLRALGPEPFSAAFVEPCRRPTDGRYGENPIRMQHYFQYQVVLKPAPLNIVDLYLGSLKAIGILPEEHDLRFVHDDWESPTLGAWGLGWEVWADGMEVTQFTYFQQVGGFELKPIMGEITYGLERLCMFLQQVDNVYDLAYNDQFKYGDIFHQNEVQGSRFDFELANVALLQEWFGQCEAECQRLCAAKCPVVALDYCLKASHSFNLLDARGAISVNERQSYILRVRDLARQVAAAWLQNREELGFPLLARAEPPRPTMPGAESLTVAAGDRPSDTDAAPLLIEVGVEEMPAQVFRSLLEQLPRLFQKHFEPTELQPTDVEFFLTPRRIAISVGSLRRRQSDLVQELKGPPLRLARDAAGRWTEAALGFARKNQVDPANLEVAEIKGVPYVVARNKRYGWPASELLLSVVPALLADLHWYKTMRWGRGDQTPFVRPVQWLVVLLGTDVVPVEFAGVTADRYSRGHRFMADLPVALDPDRQDYLNQMRANHVLVDHRERQVVLRQHLEQQAAAAGLTWVADEGLLDEVTWLVENPVPVLCTFDEDYLRIPDAVLISEMRTHQRYFALRQPDGRLANRFVAFSNMACQDLALVRQGYEKVLRSRFADASFFLAEDLKRPLAERVTDLDQRVFQAELGSVGDKVRRLRRLGAFLARALDLDFARQAVVEQIALLCKADLGTAMVGEFPELQGDIGCYYAHQQGLDPTIADGIRDHYRPRLVDDEYPATDEAALVGLADRIDTLVGVFGIGRAPTSSSDPFALRRACLTTIAIIVKRGFRLDLRALFREAIRLYGGTAFKVTGDELLTQLLEFTRTRAKVLFAEQSRPGIPGGFAKDTIEAVTRATTPWSDVADLVARLQAMTAFRQRPDFAPVAATFKRCNNILTDEGRSGEVDPAQLPEAAERDLLAAVMAAEPAIAQRLGAGDYVGALAAVAPLRAPADVFFDQVLVNAEAPALRANRQRLVGRVVRSVMQVADFAAIAETT